MCFWCFLMSSCVFFLHSNFLNWFVFYVFFLPSPPNFSCYVFSFLLLQIAFSSIFPLVFLWCFLFFPIIKFFPLLQKFHFCHTYSMCECPFLFFSLFIFCQPFFLLILFSSLVFLFIGNLVVLTSQHFPRFVLKILLSRISSLFLWWIVIWSLFYSFLHKIT